VDDLSEATKNRLDWAEAFRLRQEALDETPKQDSIFGFPVVLVDEHPVLDTIGEIKFGIWVDKEDAK